MKIKKILSTLTVLMPSPVRIIIFRILGFKIGRYVKISPVSFICVDNLQLDDRAEIKPLCLIKIRNLIMGRYSVIAGFSVIFGNKDLIMSKRSRVGHSNLIDCSENIFLGEYCGLGPRNTIYTHASWLPITKGYPNNRHEVRLGNYIWTGMNNTILPGTIVGDNVITYANVVLKKEIPKDSFYTENEILPIDKIINDRSIGDCINYISGKILSTFGDICFVINDEEYEKTGEIDGIKMLIIKGGDKHLIKDKMSKNVCYIYFGSAILQEIRTSLNQRGIHWFDFSAIEMSKNNYSYKNDILDIMDRYGGLKFLEGC